MRCNATQCSAMRCNATQCDAMRRNASRKITPPGRKLDSRRDASHATRCVACAASEPRNRAFCDALRRTCDAMRRILTFLVASIFCKPFLQTFFLSFLQKQKWNSTVFWLFLFNYLVYLKKKVVTIQLKTRAIYERPRIFVFSSFCFGNFNVCSLNNFCIFCIF